MSALAQLRINDLRPRLSVKPNPPELVKRGIISRRKRKGPIKGAVIHYNGPRVPFFPNAAREREFVVNVDCPNHQARIGGDSLMYHFIVLSDGSIWQTRDIDFIAWHAAHPEANEYYVAIAMVLGEGQDATPAQWASVAALLAALRADYGFGRSNVTGHQEWSKTACPGLLQARVRAYRQAVDPAPQTGLTVVSAPRISAAHFADVLTQAGSPAAPLAAELYAICVEEGIDSAVALAFFGHESTYGLRGLTADYSLNNWGNVRTEETDDPDDAPLNIAGRGTFVKFASWQAGLRDWCQRLKGPKYAGAGLLTVEQIIPKYAPSSDSNKPQQYIQAVKAMVAGWAAGEVASPPPMVTTRWRCINKQGVNLRTSPNTKGNPVRTIAYGEVVEVGLVKMDGDVETIRGDNRWLWLASGEGFVWAGNFQRQ